MFEECYSQINKKFRREDLEYTTFLNIQPPQFLTALFFCQQQQEQDPTNLYIANLPQHFKESDLDGMLSKFGQVSKTVLRKCIICNSQR